MNIITESNRIYLENEEGLMTAEVTFPETAAGTVSIDRTFVSESLRGQGVAGLLLEAAAEKIRTDGKKAIPVCSYAVRWFEKHPQYADILK